MRKHQATPANQWARPPGSALYMCSLKRPQTRTYAALRAVVTSATCSTQAGPPTQPMCAGVRAYSRLLGEPALGRTVLRLGFAGEQTARTATSVMPIALNFAARGRHLTLRRQLVDWPPERTSSRRIQESISVEQRRRTSGALGARCEVSAGQLARVMSAQRCWLSCAARWQQRPFFGAPTHPPRAPQIDDTRDGAHLSTPPSIWAS